MRYKYILLDWDGNIANTLPAWIKVGRRIIEYYGNKRHLTDTEIAQLLHKSIYENYADYGANHGEDAAKLLTSFAREELQTVQLIEGVIEVLHEIKNSKKYQLAIVSSAFREPIEIVQKAHTLDTMFDCMVANEDVTNLKPHKEPIEKAIKLLDGTLEEAIIIGDSSSDIGAGKNAGITTVIHYPKENQTFYSPKAIQQLQADHTIYEFKELMDIIS